MLPPYEEQKRIAYRIEAIMEIVKRGNNIL
jgi:hypothetical protein